MRPKVTIVGAGNVGATTAQRVLDRGLAAVVLVDVVEGLPQGKALDLWEAGPIVGYDLVVVGSHDYAATNDSDVVVITAGLARTPGMSRDDLAATNAGIVKAVVQQIARYSPHAMLLVVSNPLDAMCWVAYRVSGFPKQRVVGMAGVLDAARMRSFLSHALGISASDIQALVLGGHGDSMVPLLRYCTVGGIPVTALLSPAQLQAIVQRTRDGGAEVVKLLKSGSAYYAPSAAVVEMVEALLLDRKRVVPCAAYLDGEYGLRGVFLGVPVVLGAGGIERIIEVECTAEERAALRASAAQVQAVIERLQL